MQSISAQRPEGEKKMHYDQVKRGLIGFEGARP